MMPQNPIIVWFRQDLRLQDNPAFLAACQTGHPVLPLFLWTPEEEKSWQPGAASRWWLHQSLRQLSHQIEELQGKLILRRGSSAFELLVKIIQESGAESIYWNRRYEPAVISRDKTIKLNLEKQNIHAQSFNSALLWEPWEILQNSGKPYQVFTAFWNKLRSLPPPARPQPIPKEINFHTSLASLHLEELQLEPKINWTQGLQQNWEPGELGAQKNLKKFLKAKIQNYQNDRDLPYEQGTSRLSPHLHFGEISPRQIWHAVQKETEHHAAIQKNVLFYLRELAWRDFAHHLLYHFPQSPEQPLQSKFDKFPWIRNQKHLRAWQKGLTGYPIVDAGMRELWTTGYMHNRVRMIAASFLIKDLQISWNAGAAWFWDTLVDADLANNTLGWQWSAGCGADAAPFFRVFNPVLQSKKFDPQGDYLRCWLPELEKLPSPYIHEPWKTSPEILNAAQVRLGESYPFPLVDHQGARQKILSLFKNLAKN